MSTLIAMCRANKAWPEPCKDPDTVLYFGLIFVRGMYLLFILKYVILFYDRFFMSIPALNMQE